MGSTKLRGAYNAIIALNENDRQNGIYISAVIRYKGVAYTANNLI